MVCDQSRAHSKRKAMATEKGKGVSTSSDPHPRTPPTSVTAPWPRPEATPFMRVGTNREVTRMKNVVEWAHRQKGEAWSRCHSIFYNQLLRNRVIPTRFVCPETLTRMGILEDVQTILGRIGLGTMPFINYPLYPELVRQFLASVDIHFSDGGHHSPQEASITYICRGMLYEISIIELCGLYGFDRSAKAKKFPRGIPGVAELWYRIAFDGYEPRSAKLTRIRNPAVRMVAKILGALISGKAEPGAVSMAEIGMLFYGLAPTIPDLFQAAPSRQHGVNFGFCFADMLVQRKFRGTSIQPVDEPIGSLLTPIFHYHGIDLSTTECIDTFYRFDEEHLLHTGYLKSGLLYNYVDRERHPHTWQLPSPDVTSVTSRANLEFLPHITDVPLQSPPPQHHRPSSSRPTASRLSHDQWEDYQQPPAGYDQFEEILPEYAGEFTLPPPPDISDEIAYRRWMVESTMKNNSFLERVWGAIRRIRVPTPSCFSQPPRSERDAASQDATAAADEPIVAGHGTDVTDDEQLVRLPRQRRQPGQSRSVSPDA